MALPSMEIYLFLGETGDIDPLITSLLTRGNSPCLEGLFPIFSQVTAVSVFPFYRGGGEHGPDELGCGGSYFSSEHCGARRCDGGGPGRLGKPGKEL